MSALQIQQFCLLSFCGCFVRKELDRWSNSLLKISSVSKETNQLKCNTHDCHLDSFLVRAICTSTRKTKSNDDKTTLWHLLQEFPQHQQDSLCYAHFFDLLLSAIEMKSMWKPFNNYPNFLLNRSISHCYNYAKGSLLW